MREKKFFNQTNSTNRHLKPHGISIKPRSWPAKHTYQALAPSPTRISQGIVVSWGTQPWDHLEKIPHISIFFDTKLYQHMFGQAVSHESRGVARIIACRKGALHAFYAKVASQPRESPSAIVLDNGKAGLWIQSKVYAAENFFESPSQAVQVTSYCTSFTQGRHCAQR